MKSIIKTTLKLSLAVALLAGATVVSADDHHAFEDIMKKGFKGKTSLVGKVKGGSASAAEIKELQGMFAKLAKMEPPKGDAKSWKAKTAALIHAGELVAKHDGKAKAAFDKATNCKACHSVHKPD
jgi:hypothetical protein